jgi:hypothetical protein
LSFGDILDLLESSSINVIMNFQLVMKRPYKLSNIYAGVTTISGVKSTRGGHRDGPSEDANFSTDTEICYNNSRCSLLVIDT